MTTGVLDVESVPLTIPSLMRTSAERFGEADLLVTPHSRMSFVDAELRSRALAQKLVGIGVGKGTRVGLMYPNGPDWIVAWLAIARVGAMSVPINTYFQPLELRRTLRHADVEHLVMVAEFLGHGLEGRMSVAAPGLAAAEGSGPLFVPEIPSLRHVWIPGGGSVDWAGDLDRLPAAIDDEMLAEVESEVVPADLLIVIYTSGSTADPKGVVHCHGAVVRHSRRVAARSGIMATDRIASSMPFFWIGGLGVLMGAIHTGCAVLADQRFDPPETLGFLERERCTIYRGWPHARGALVADPTFATRDLSSLRIPLQEPEGVSHNSLGMTESCGPHTMGQHDAPPLTSDQAGSFGWPVAGVEHRIVDRDTNAPLADGDEGEICIRGEDVMVGMIKRERGEVFDQDGWYHTGDAGFLRGELLHFTGRLGEMIKSNGMNVAPAEVEAVLQLLPEIAMAVVVGIPSDSRGEEVAAVVVAARGHDPDPDEVISKVRKAISSYKVPRRVLVVGEQELPLRDSGKVDKRAVTRLFARAE